MKLAALGLAAGLSLAPLAARCEPAPTPEGCYSRVMETWRAIAYCPERGFEVRVIARGRTTVGTTFTAYGPWTGTGVGLMSEVYPPAAGWVFTSATHEWRVRQ